MMLSPVLIIKCVETRICGLFIKSSMVVASGATSILESGAEEEEIFYFDDLTSVACVTPRMLKVCLNLSVYTTYVFRAFGTVITFPRTLPEIMRMSFI